MARIAFLGLGMMGSRMARRLIEAGNDVTVWNRTRERSEALAQAGAGVADSPAKAVVGAEFVITMLATPQAVEEVLFSDEGMAGALSPGQTWIDMSTIGPEQFRHAAARLPRGVVAVDAPVRGSVPEATAGTLQIFVGADDNQYELVHALLSRLGDAHHVGGPGDGAATKVVVNLVLVEVIVAFGEALALGDALGLDRQALLDVLAESPIAGIVRAKRQNVEGSEFPPNFKLALATKDIGLVDAAATATGTDLRASEAARQWMDMALAQGKGELDYSAVVATILGARADGG